MSRLHIILSLIPALLLAYACDPASGRLTFSKAERIARITGSTLDGETFPNSNNTAKDNNIGGTDLGIIWEMNNGEYGVLFGDTYGKDHFGADGPTGVDWRCNVLLFSKDSNPADGFTFSGMVSDSSGTFAREIIYGAKDTSGNGDWTSIPTGAVSANGKEYIHYMNIKEWIGWETNYSGMYRSSDNGRNWEKCESVHFGADSNFGQAGYYKKDGYVYMIGTETGRHSRPRLARFEEEDIEDCRKYEYWNSGESKWIAGDEEKATNLFDDTTGELSFIYHTKTGKWILTYFCEDRYSISVRYAEEITGPWSEPQILATGMDFPQLYGSYIHPSSADADHLYFLMSMWKPYNVFLMKTKIGTK